MEIKIVTGEGMPERAQTAANLMALDPIGMAEQLNVGNCLQFPDHADAIDVMRFVRDAIHAQYCGAIALYVDEENSRLWRIA